MSIEAHFSRGEVPRDVLMAVFVNNLNADGGVAAFERLERLDIQNFEDTWGDNFPSDFAFGHMPSPRYLSFEAPGLKCHVSWGLGEWHLEELRVLRLKNCNFLEHKHLDDPLLNRFNCLRDFERLEGLKSVTVQIL